jgi:hypothetical protein
MDEKVKETAASAPEKLSQAVKIKTLEEEVAELKRSLHDGLEESDSDIIEREIKKLYDPYKDNNPFKFLASVPPDLCPEPWPAGGKLGWKNPIVRDRRGMRGWRFVSWDSPLGKKLDKYLANPPVRMKGPEHLDGMIRRGDLALGIIDKKLADTRKLRSELESARMRGQLSSKQKKKLGYGVTMEGKGLRTDDTGAKIYGPVEEFEGSDHARHSMHKRIEAKE